jgi:hypothetical protein
MKYVDVQGVSFVTVLSTAGVMVDAGFHGVELPCCGQW